MAVGSSVGRLSLAVYKHPAKALSMVIMLCSYLYVLNYLAGLAYNFPYIDLTLNARTIHNTLGS